MRTLDTTRHAMAGGWAWLDIAHRRWAARDRAAGARVRMRIRMEDEKKNENENEIDNSNPSFMKYSVLKPGAAA